MRIYTLIDQLVRHEGLRLKPYRCSAGKLTIGIGRNLDDVGITEEEARRLARSDVQRVQVELQGVPVFNQLNEARQMTLANMAFNLGMPRLRQFRRMWAALELEDYDLAAVEMLDSRWAEQVGRRANELADQMRSGLLSD